MFTPDEQSKILMVKAIIKSKMEALDELVAGFNGGRTNYFVSGGCIASLLQDEEPKDYDVYFRSAEILDGLKNYLTTTGRDKVAEVESKYREVETDDGKLITENAITLNNHIQIILKHTGEPEAVRRTFDFVHCMPYYDSKDGMLHISKVQHEAIMTKILRVNTSNAVTKHRIEKFQQRKYTYHGPQIPWP
jgi:hypothetical protein